jgi:folate-binding protein YgfZ
VHLAHLGILRFTGPDALSFLQGQVSSDTRRLADNVSLLSSYSSPQGRVLALIYLLPHSSGIAAILPREILQPTLERMRKFVLRAKVKIEDAGDSLQIAGVHGEQALRSLGLPVPESPNGYVEHHGIGVARVQHDANRFWVIGAAAKLAGAGAAAAGSSDAWRLADIRAGLPQVYAATSEAFVAQMLNLDLLDGISFTKGCYTGQEIIARAHYRGQVKRRMRRFESQAPCELKPGQAGVLADGRGFKVVEAVARADGRCEFLAVTNPAPADNLAVGAPDEAEVPADAQTQVLVAARQLPLPYELPAIRT